MGQYVRLRCTLCGHDRPQAAFGLDTKGAYDPDSGFDTEMSLRIDTIGGRGRLTVERQPVPLAIAYGILDALKAAVARVEADILEADGELPDEEDDG